MSCGLQYALENIADFVIDRFPGWEIGGLPVRTSSPAMDRGNVVHAAFEAYLKGGDHFPDEFVGGWGKHFADLKLTLEICTHSGSEVMWSFDDYWFPDLRRPWHRAKLDAWHVTGERATVIDFKTGKMYPDKHAEAMEVYALDTFAMFDAVQVVSTALWYVDQPIYVSNPLSKEFRREEASKLARRWEVRAERFRQDTHFVASPGAPHCYFCAFNAKRKGGPCTKGI